jgi:hypothetical protein
MCLRALQTRRGGSGYREARSAHQAATGAGAPDVRAQFTQRSNTWSCVARSFFGIRIAARAVRMQSEQRNAIDLFR